MNITPIANAEAGLSARQKLNVLIDLYNRLAVSDGSFNLQSFLIKYPFLLQGLTDGLSKIEFIPTDGGAGIINVYDSAGVLKTTINGSNGITSQAFIKSGGASSQFLKANGTVDSTAYQTALINGLADLLGINPSTGNIPITSPNGLYNLYVTNTGLKIEYYDGTTEAYAVANIAKYESSYNNGTGNDGKHTIDSAQNTLSHSEKVFLNSLLIEVSQDPTTPLGVATKNYIDNIRDGIDYKPNVKVSTTANITLSGIQNLDGVTGVSDMRVAVRFQTTASQNGIYLMKSGAWVRSTDGDTGLELEYAVIPIESGTLYGGKVYRINQTGIVLGTTAITFTEWNVATYAAGIYLKLVGNVFDIDFTTFDTGNITEGTKLFFTNARALTAAPAETAATIGALVNGATNYPTPLDADLFGIWDFANSLYKKASWANIKATLAGYFVSYQILTPTLSATPTINTGTFRETFVDFTGLNTNITDLSANLSGTPSNGARLKIRWKDNGTARTIVHGSKFAAKGVSLLGTTVIGKESETAYDWNSNTNLWGCVASVTEV